MNKKGLVQIYTGNGKGKTTAALGLAVRAAGAGKRIAIYQFLKPTSLELGERQALAEAALPITIEPLDIEWNMAKSFSDPATVNKAKQKIAELCENISRQAKNKQYDVIILDEIIFCLSGGLVDLQMIKNIIDSRDESVEIVMTGRGATKALIDIADLVTEMKEIKHPYRKGIGARKGIEF